MPTIQKGSGEDDHPVAEFNDGTKWTIVNITVGEINQWPSLNRCRLAVAAAKSGAAVVGKKSNANTNAAETGSTKKPAAAVSKKPAKKEAKVKEACKRPGANALAAGPAAKVGKKMHGPPMPEEYKGKVPLVMSESGNAS